jgi:F-box and WD-40 domain protein CDC4
LRHTLAAHTGAITCFQHDEFKVLSGSDGNLKMWNVRDGMVVRDLLTGITGVWQVVFEGRWCVAASNRNDTTVLDVWNFGMENDEDWVGEPPGGLYDEDIFSEDDEEEEEEEETHRRPEEDEDQEQADVDAMDQDLVVSSDSDSILEIEYDQNDQDYVRQPELDNADVEIPEDVESQGVDASRWAPQATVSVTSLAAGPSSSSSLSSHSRPQKSLASSRRRQQSPPPAAGGSSSLTSGTTRTLPPTNDETPTAPRRLGRQQSQGHPTRRR